MFLTFPSFPSFTFSGHLRPTRQEPAVCPVPSSIFTWPRKCIWFYLICSFFYSFSNVGLGVLPSDLLTVEQVVSSSSSRTALWKPRFVLLREPWSLLRFFMMKSSSSSVICGWWCSFSGQSRSQWRVDSSCCPQGYSRCSVALEVLSLGVVLVWHWKAALMARKLSVAISMGTLRLGAMVKSSVGWWMLFYCCSGCGRACTRRYVRVAGALGYLCVVSATAVLALLSVSSFPSIPLCDGIQTHQVRSCLCALFMIRWRASRAYSELFVLYSLRVWRADWLLTYTIKSSLQSLSDRYLRVSAIAWSSVSYTLEKGCRWNLPLMYVGPLAIAL